MINRFYLISVTLLLSIVSHSTYAQVFTNYTTAQGLINNNVSSLVIDSSDHVWFGTQAGVSMFDGNTWTTHSTSTDPGFVNDIITCIAVTADQDIWIGTDFGVSVYNGSSWTTYTENDGLGDNRVNWIEEDNMGNIWFGEQDGLSKFDGNSWTTYNMSNGLPFGGIEHISVAANNDLWLCTPFSGFYHFDGTTFTAYTEGNGLLSDVTRAIAIDAANNKYVGNADGISVFDNSNLWVEDHEIMLPLPPPDSLNPVEDVKIDSKGNLWAGIYVDYLVTEGGVAWYDGSTWTAYDVSDGLIGPVVRRIAIDSNDDVWVATSTGVSEISGIPTGIEDLKERTQFVHFPNPLSTQFTIICDESDIKQDSRLYIYDSTGKLQKVETIYSNFQSVDCSSLSNGVYQLRFGTGFSRIVVNK